MIIIHNEDMLPLISSRRHDIRRKKHQRKRISAHDRALYITLVNFCQGLAIGGIYFGLVDIVCAHVTGALPSC